jgi:hypothetical protein
MLGHLLPNPSPDGRRFDRYILTRSSLPPSLPSSGLQRESVLGHLLPGAGPGRWRVGRRVSWGDAQGVQVGREGERERRGGFTMLRMLMVSSDFPPSLPSSLPPSTATSTARRSSQTKTTPPTGSGTSPRVRPFLPFLPSSLPPSCHSSILFTLTLPLPPSLLRWLAFFHGGPRMAYC